mmetsp:Transcript_134070/g.334611  ORF Transcript_134070/g.334611 Transcript_134070/m.334611 type:complete len:315 (+) Transcript_134070:506-1450(+)
MAAAVAATRRRRRQTTTRGGRTPLSTAACSDARTSGGRRSRASDNSFAAACLVAIKLTVRYNSAGSTVLKLPSRAKLSQPCFDKSVCNTASTATFVWQSNRMRRGSRRAESMRSSNTMQAANVFDLPDPKTPRTSTGPPLLRRSASEAHAPTWRRTAACSAFNVDSSGASTSSGGKVPSCGSGPTFAQTMPSKVANARPSGSLVFSPLPMPHACSTSNCPSSAANAPETRADIDVNLGRPEARCCSSQATASWFTGVQSNLPRGVTPLQSARTSKGAWSCGNNTQTSPRAQPLISPRNTFVCCPIITAMPLSIS